jgi:hypothetical protein
MDNNNNTFHIVKFMAGESFEFISLKGSWGVQGGGILHLLMLILRAPPTLTLKE